MSQQPLNPATFMVAVELSLADLQMLHDVLTKTPFLPVSGERWLPVAETLRAAGRDAIAAAAKPAQAGEGAPPA